MTLRSCVMTGVAIAAMATLALTSGKAAAELPPSPITLVAGATGGSTDLAVRAIAARIEEMGGPHFVIENRPGGGGVPAAIGVRNAKPDGRTLLVASYSAFVVGRLMEEKEAFSPLKDFKLITTLFTFPLVAVVNAGLEARSVDELAALSKRKKEGIVNGTQGVGAAGHLLGEMFAQSTGANVVHVPYKGAGQAIVDLVAGRTDMMFVSFAPSAPHIKAGKLRALAIATDGRIAAAPDLPTFAELGHPDVSSNFVWFGLAAPRETPDSVTQSIREWFVKAVQDEALRKRLDVQGIKLESSSADVFAKRIANDAKTLRPIVEAAQKKK